VDTLCGPMSALPPEGSLQVLEDMPVKAGGCAANVAIDLARQGIAAEVIGCVGCDSAADVLLNTFETHGIGPSRIVRVGRCATSRTVILLVEGQDRRFLHVTGANSVFTVDHL
jgi:sugar/nucleoside kinase (ribokinase family)